MSDARHRAIYDELAKRVTAAEDALAAERAETARMRAVVDAARAYRTAQVASDATWSHPDEWRRRVAVAVDARDRLDAALAATEVPRG